MKTMVKLNELSFELLPHPPYSPNPVHSDYWLFADLKKILQGKRFGSNEEVSAETEAYFESKDESFYKKRHQKVIVFCFVFQIARNMFCIFKKLTYATS